MLAELLTDPKAAWSLLQGKGMLHGHNARCMTRVPGLCNPAAAMPDGLKRDWSAL